MIRFDIPAYQAAMTAFAHSVLRGLADQGPVLGRVRREPTVHAGPTRNLTGTPPVDHPMLRLEQRSSISDDVVRHGRLDDYNEVLVGMAADFRDQVVGHLGRVCKARARGRRRRG